MVQVTCTDEHLGAFNTWYNSHLPNLLRIPGLTWAQRYINLEESEGGAGLRLCIESSTLRISRRYSTATAALIFTP